LRFGVLMARYLVLEHFTLFLGISPRLATPETSQPKYPTSFLGKAARAVATAPPHRRPHHKTNPPTSSNISPAGSGTACLAAPLPLVSPKHASEIGYSSVSTTT